MFPTTIVARAPSLIIFGTLETLLGALVYTQYVRPNRNSVLPGPITSHIPAGTVNFRRRQ